jgi:hypothetical protein
MVIEDSAVAEANAKLPIEVTLFGMIIEVNELPSKADGPIEVTSFGMIAVPAQLRPFSTTFKVIVKVPPPEQLSV